MSAPKIHRVAIDGRALADWEAFHTVFAEKLGFPGYYGRNLDAWHDCFYSLAEESTVLKLADGDVVLLDVANYQDLKARQPGIAEFILEGSALVNFILREQREEVGVQGLSAVAVSAYE